jgi:hypothetical protein
MPEFVAVSVRAVLLAALLSFIWGGIYFAVLANRLGRIVGLDGDGQGRMPPQALIVAFLTRLVQAFGTAAVLAAAGVSGVAGGAVGGLTIFCLLLLPIMAGQAAFGPPWGSWRRLLVGVPEALVGFVIMGATGVLWR